LTEKEIVGKLNQAPKPLFIVQAKYLQEKSLGTLCFL